MKMQKIVGTAKALTGGTIAVLFLGWCTTSIGSDIYEGFVYRDESTYLISRMHDPLWKKSGYIPDDVVCSSPAHCEPSGKPSMQYFVLLGEHEVRGWGLDPAQHTPVKGNPYF